ncbi:MAG: TPM domain-containing protein [Bifidobacteriaceae bacterium]|jgi:uncharacterized protein|nr:TPM domain-containing protein [Bifidobacteriaceae bacterium]
MSPRAAVAGRRGAALALGLGLALAGAAWGTASGAAAQDAASPASGLPLLVDGADLLGPADEAALGAELGRISRERGADVVVVTVPELDGRSATAFADDFFDYGPSPEDPFTPGSDASAGYGQGPTRSGVLFLVSMDDRDWALSTTGESIEVFSDARQERIVQAVVPALSRGAWKEALGEFARLVDKTYYDDARVKWEWVGLAALGAALVGGLAPVTVWRRQLKSVRPAVAALPYLDPSSLTLTQSTDRMVRQYTTVVDLSSSGGGGSGSGSHFGSSGIAHGGMSGKF